MCSNESEIGFKKVLYLNRKCRNLENNTFSDITLTLDNLLKTKTVKTCFDTRIAKKFSKCLNN